MLPSGWNLTIILVVGAVDKNRSQALESPDAAALHLLHHLPNVLVRQFMAIWQRAQQKPLTLLTSRSRRHSRRRHHLSLAGALAAASAPPSPLPSFSLPPRSTRPPFNAPTRQRAPVRELITPPLRRSRRSRSETLGQAASGKGVGHVGARGKRRRPPHGHADGRGRARKEKLTRTRMRLHLYIRVHPSQRLGAARSARHAPQSASPAPSPLPLPSAPSPPAPFAASPRTAHTYTHMRGRPLATRRVVLSVSIAFPCGEALTAAVPKHSQRAQHAARAHAYALHHLDHAAPGRSRSARPAVRGRSWTAQM